MSKPSINWDHVAPEFKWLTENSSGYGGLHSGDGDQPVKIMGRDKVWHGNGDKWCPANYFASYIPGTCDWKDSLVERPEGEE